MNDRALLSDAQRLDWLRLIRSENVGPRTFRALFDRHGGAAQALAALPDIARRTGRSLRIASREDAEREMEAAARWGVRFVALGEADYPQALRAIDSAPPLIALRGQGAALKMPTVAIVGSRNASAVGLKFTERLARGLGAAGFCVVSGLARGIDSWAHESSLETGTVAVLAGGHDEIYPPENERLLGAILERGAAISEMRMGHVPIGRDFPRRNRLISGLSLGVVIVEAARKSGSLITARFALEQGREVFAVPGSPLDPRAEGANDLIRQGATLCTDAEHVVSVLTPLIEKEQPPGLRETSGEPGEEPLWDELDMRFGGDAGAHGVKPAPAAPVAQVNGTASEQVGHERLISLLGPAPISIDDLVRMSGLAVRDVQAALLDLELAGRLTRHGGNAVSLI
jgi:DNA processing protein